MRLGVFNYDKSVNLLLPVSSSSEDTESGESPDMKKRRVASPLSDSAEPMDEDVEEDSKEDEDVEEDSKEDEAVEEDSKEDEAVEEDSKEDEDVEEDSKEDEDVVQETIEAALATVTMRHMRHYYYRYQALFVERPQFKNFLFVAAGYIYRLLYNEEDLCRYGCCDIMSKQEESVWNLFVQRGDERHFFEKANKEAFSMWDICEMIIQTKIDRKKCPLVWELDVASYARRLEFFIGNPAIKKCPFEDPSCMDVVRCRLHDIKQATRQSKSAPRLTVEDYTTLLKQLLMDNDEKFWDAFLDKVVQMFDIEAVHRIDRDASSESKGREEALDPKAFDPVLKGCLEEATLRRASMMKEMLYHVLLPLESLCCTIDCSLSDEVSQLVILAELRRKAEGSQFISRKHFLWAFADRGYDLLAEIGNAGVSSMDDADHPPYHIYGTSICLAKHLGKTCVEPAHLAFAVVFGSHVRCSPDELTNMENDFNRVFPDDLKSQSDEVGRLHI